MDVYPQRVELTEKISKFFGNSLGEKDRYPAPDADNFYMRDVPQAAQQVFKDFCGQGENVSARQQNIPDLGVAGDILDLFLVIYPAELGG